MLNLKIPGIKVHYMYNDMHAGNLYYCCDKILVSFCVTSQFMFVDANVSNKKKYRYFKIILLFGARFSVHSSLQVFKTSLLQLKIQVICKYLDVFDEN